MPYCVERHFLLEVSRDKCPDAYPLTRIFKAHI